MTAPQGCHSSAPMTNLVACFLAMFTIMICLLRPAAAQSSPISTNMPVPPLQWLNLAGMAQGSPPQPLKDSSIGYDEATRTLIIFGGESQAELPQPDTYLLNLDTLTWSTPLTKVSTQTLRPPPRSRALGTGDFAANSRRGFVVYGGKGVNNNSLGDVWAYDYVNQFWVNVSLSGSPPIPRWGTVGGIDPSVVPGSGNNVNSTFNIAGGSDSKQSFPSSDLWQLVITGTLASDVTAVEGQWQDISLTSALPGKSGAGGALISASQASPARIVVSGGCSSNVNPLNANVTCIDPSTYVLTLGSSGTPISPCPAPRFDPVIVPNLNPSSASFSSQAFMLLGNFDSSKWNDGGGLNKGEVAVLDSSAGTWARILPAGDPESGGTPTFPSPREGAASLSFPSALVGNNRQDASDIIVFGGRDAHGNYLNDLWILRSYNGSITKSGDHGPGFGNGDLGTGASASGSGVTVQYLTQCAQQFTPTATSSSSSSFTTSNAAQETHLPSQTPASTSSPVPTFDASIVHKLLSPVSIAMALAATIIARMSFPAASQSPGSVERRHALAYIAIPAGVAAYTIGVAGFATSITSITRSSTNLQRRDGASTDTFLKTVHAQAGFALFLGLYGLVPVFAFCLWLGRWKTRAPSESPADEDAKRKDSVDTAALTGEKELPSIRGAGSPAQSMPDVHSTESSVRARRQRAHSGPGLFPGLTGREQGDSSEPGPATPTKGFEVTNRPRRASGGMALYPPRDHYNRPRTEMVRSLSDISWLERRRSLGAVGELDYALSQLGHASPRSASPPATSRPPTVTMSNRPFVRTPSPPPPSSVRLDGWDVALHTLFHAFLLANCILALVALFSRAPIATFAVFLVWTLAFYIWLLILAWNGRPRGSILVNTFSRFRNPPIPSQGAPTASPVPGSPMDDRASPFLHTPTPGGSPYIFHQPPWRRAVSPEEDRATRTSHLHTVEADDPEEDEDDDDRQRHMEEELERRDVNIVTVPRRKLWIANPS